jgi:hypothetical protein
MSDADEVSRVAPADRRTADPTPGTVREQAIDVDGLWSRFVRTEPGHRLRPRRSSPARAPAR